MRNMQALSNAYNLGDKWLEREFRHVNFGDQRLIKRLIKTSSLIESKAFGSINQSCRSWKEAKGAYRLFSNKKFDPAGIYYSHYKETQERIKGNEFVFSVQDTTYLDFDSHIKTKGLGSVSKSYTKHKMGLIVHSALMFTMEGLPLGLSSQQCWARVIREETAQEKSRRKYISSTEDKESYKWIAALKDTMHIIPKDTKVITIGDREADIFELLWSCQEKGSLFIVRNRQNRKFISTEGRKTNLQTHINQISAKKEIVIQVPKKNNEAARMANIEIKYMFGLIPIRTPSLYGSKNTEHKISDKVVLYVVRAKEQVPPKGVEAIDWLLLTNVPVSNFEDTIERINWYKLRWRIEEYFRVLKSGCKIENSRLATKERLEKLIAIKSIIAFKILYLSKVAISHPQEVCTKILTSQEWQTLYIREHKTIFIPEEPPTMKQAIIWLGKLGGFMNRKNDKLPGTMTLWRGYENLTESIEILSIFLSQNCG